MNMTPQQKIKHIILNLMADWAKEPRPEVTAENVDELYDDAEDKQDAIYKVREGEVETKLPSQFSRHYEAKEVAAKAPDGSWVGWTYWYGGGKWGEPEAIDWMSEAYALNCAEEEKVVVVRTFTKTQEPA